MVEIGSKEMHVAVVEPTLRYADGTRMRWQSVRRADQVREAEGHPRGA